LGKRLDSQEKSLASDSRAFHPLRPLDVLPQDAFGGGLPLERRRSFFPPDGDRWPGSSFPQLNAPACDSDRRFPEQGDAADSMRMVELHQFGRGHRLFTESDSLCFRSKNLFNATLHRARQSFFDNDYKNYYALQKEFQGDDQPDYRALPAKVAQQIMMLVELAFKSYFALRKIALPDGPRPGLPQYLDRKTGRQALIYTSQAVSFREK
jgi:hypothetical protein